MSSDPPVQGFAVKREPIHGGLVRESKTHYECRWNPAASRLSVSMLMKKDLCQPNYRSTVIRLRIGIAGVPGIQTSRLAVFPESSRATDGQAAILIDRHAAKFSFRDELTQLAHLMLANARECGSHRPGGLTANAIGDRWRRSRVVKDLLDRRVASFLAIWQGDETVQLAGLPLLEGHHDHHDFAGFANAIGVFVLLADLLQVRGKVDLINRELDPP